MKSIGKFALIALLAASNFGCGKRLTSDESRENSTPKAQTCPSRLSECTDDVICIGARTKTVTQSTSAPYWSETRAFKPYVKEAKSRGLSCSGF